jgi:hypothetical protein
VIAGSTTWVRQCATFRVPELYRGIADTYYSHMLARLIGPVMPTPLENMFGRADKEPSSPAATGGIGLGIATVLAEAGATVAIADRNIEGAEREAAALTATGLNVSATALDLADGQSVITACAQTVASVGNP